jgi:hypothetical protein
MAYVSTPALKSYLGITETTDDELLGTMIGAAEAAIDSYCRQTFEAGADATRYFDPTCDVYGYHPYYRSGLTLRLDYPLCAITSVTNGDGNVVSSSNYVTEPRNITPWYALTLKANATTIWTWTTTPENSIAIAGKWAYSLVAPADVAQAATRLAAFMFRQRDNGLDLDRIIQTAGGVAMPPDLPRDVTKLLAPYRRLV